MTRLSSLPFRRVLRRVEKLSRAEGAVGNEFKRVRADRAARPPTVNASEILDGAKYRRSTFARLSAHVSLPWESFRSRAARGVPQ